MIGSFKTTTGEVLGCGAFTKEYTIVATWDASIDDYSDIISYEYKSYNPTTGWVYGPVNVGNSLSRVGTFSVGEGTYGFAVRAIDLVGNKSGWTSADIASSCKITYDKTAPVVNVVNPVANQLFNNSIKIDIAASDAQTSIKSVSMNIYKVDGSTKTLVSGCTTIPTVFDETNWTTTINNGGSCHLSEGRYEIAAWAYDLAGNPGWAQRVQFNLDTTAPTGTIDGLYYVKGANTYTLNNWSTNTTTPVFKGTYADANGVSSVLLSIASFTDNAQLDNGTWMSPTLGPITTDGTHTLTVTITDKAGNTKVLTQNITIDTKAPTAVYTHYNNGVEVLGAQAYVKSISQLSFTGTYTDDTLSSGLYWDSFVIFDAQTDGSFRFDQNGAKSYCSWRQAPNLVTLSGNPFTLTTQRQFTDCVATLPEGTYYMTHQVYDNATRKDIPTINQFRDVLGLKFTVDTTAPVSQFTQNQANTYHSSSILLQGVSNDVNGVNKVSLYYKDTNSSNWNLIETQANSSNSSTFSWSKTWTPPYQGTFDVKAEAIDLAGNTEHSPMMTNIVYDTSFPTIGKVTLTIDYLGKYINGTSGFLMTVPVNDSLSGINTSSCMYTLDGSTWLNGYYLNHKCTFGISSNQLFDNQELNIRAKVTDHAGNTVTSNIVNRKVDKDLAQSQATIDNAYYGPNSLPLIKGTASDTVSNVTNVNVTLRRRNDNKYWFWGNIWTTFPTMHGVSGKNNWILTQNLPSMQNGITYTVTPYAWDQVHALPGTGIADSFIWDNQAPQNPTSIISTSHTVNGYSKNNEIGMNFSGASDNLSGVKGYYYSFSKDNPETPAVSNSNWLPVGTNSVTSQSLADGVWYFNIRTIDNVENITSTAYSGSYIIDTTPPTTPENLYFKDLDNNQDIQCGGYSNTKHISEYWDASVDTNLDHYEYSSYNAPNGSVGLVNEILYSNSYDTNWWEIPSQGTYGFQVRAVDKAGNKSEWALINATGIENSCQINIDWVNPTVDLVFATPGPDAKGFQAVFSEDVNETEAKDPHNYFLFNYPMFSASNGDLSEDAIITYDPSSQTATVTFPTNSGWYISPEQEWGVQNIHDLAGNILSVNPYSEYSTPMKPPVTTASGIDTNWHNSDVTVTLTCTDGDGSGCDQTYYSLNGGTENKGTSFTVSTEGENTITFYSEDMAGNTEDPKVSVVVKIDKTSPTINSMVILNGLLTVTSTDTLSDVKSVEVQINGGTWTPYTPGMNLYALVSNVPGTYTVSVRVTDNANNSTTESTSFTIVQPATTPGGQTLGARTQRTALATTSTLTEETSETTTEEEITEEEILGETTCEATYKISGTVYYDNNDNGIKDDNEKVVKDIKVNIYNSNKELEKTVTTDEKGYWEASLCPGEYTTQVEGAEEQSFVLGDSDTTLDISVEKKTNWWLIAVIGSAVVILLVVLADRYNKRKVN